MPDWAKGNKEAEARYAQQAAEWEKIENSYRKDYGYTSPPSMRQLENESMTKLAKLETVQAEISVNTPAMTISPAFSLPPGIDPKDLRALAQAGVSNPELASPANEKQPNTQQSMQVAEAEIGGRQS